MACGTDGCVYAAVGIPARDGVSVGAVIDGHSRDGAGDIVCAGLILQCISDDGKLVLQLYRGWKSIPSIQTTFKGGEVERCGDACKCARLILELGIVNIVRAGHGRGVDAFHAFVGLRVGQGNGNLCRLASAKEIAFGKGHTLRLIQIAAFVMIDDSNLIAHGKGLRERLGTIVDGQRLGGIILIQIDGRGDSYDVIRNIRIVPDFRLLHFFLGAARKDSARCNEGGHAEKSHYVIHCFLRCKWGVTLLRTGSRCSLERGRYYR